MDYDSGRFYYYRYVRILIQYIERNILRFDQQRYGVRNGNVTVSPDITL